VQWHPEWKFAENPFYTAILNAFGEACQARHTARLAGASN
jgi:putative glutamine amidotransferase